MSALQVQREQILAEARFEIQKYEARASFDEYCIRNLKSQIDTRDWDLRRTLEGYMEASQAKDRLQQEVADRERALQEDRLRGFQEIESMKRNHEFYVDEFSRTKLQEESEYHQQSSWTKCENYSVRLITCMIQRISRTPSRCTVDNSHMFPMIQRYFLTKMSEEICLAAPKLCRPILVIRSLHRETFLQVHLHILRHLMKRIPTPWDHPDTGRVSERTSTGQPVTEDGDGGKSAIPNPKFLGSSSTRNSFAPMKGRNFTNYGVDQQRLQIPEPHFVKFPTP